MNYAKKTRVHSKTLDKIHQLLFECKWDVAIIINLIIDTYVL